jgi:geranylgeranyl pyrophosphate synthase
VKKASDTQFARQRLVDYRRRADARLAQLFDEKRRGMRALPFAVDRYFELMGEYALRGGKRVRGLLVELGFEAVAGAPGAAVLEAFVRAAARVPPRLRRRDGPRRAAPRRREPARSGGP